jgi:DNA polymerase-1
MNVFEKAKRVHAIMLAKRNGSVKVLVPPVPVYEKNELNEISHAGARPLPAYQLVKSPAELQSVTVALDNGKIVGLDLETTGLDPRSDRVRILAMSTDTIDGGRFAYLVDCFAVDPSPLWEILAEKDLVIHNAAFDLQFLARLGFTPTGNVHDTMLLAQLLTAGTMEKVNLAACCGRWLKRDLDKAEQQSDWSGELTGDMQAYAALDVDVLLPLFKSLAAKVKEAGLFNAATIEQRCLAAQLWMGSKGVAFDLETGRALADKSAADLQRIRAQLDAGAPAVPGSLGALSSWNWDSPVQVKKALHLLGFKMESTADEALAKVDHPIGELLRQFRATAKLVSGYGRKLLEHVAPDGRVYPSWRQIGAASGRMSCSGPNMQQLPRGDYRRCVVAPPGRILVKADYSQIELRIAAKISGDQALLDAYQRGDDLHTRTARSVLGIEEVTKEHRQLAKALNFGLVFGMGVRGFRQYADSQYGLDLSENEARSYRDAFFKSYPGLAAWHRRVRSRRTAETRTLAGRRRLLDVKTPDTQRLNSPVQGTGADGLKLALALLWERLADCPGAFPVLAVHDEIVIEVDEDRADAATKWLKKAMLDAMAPLVEPVPVEVDTRIGKTWGDS